MQVDFCPASLELKNPTSETNKVVCQSGLAPKPLPKLLQITLNPFWLHVASSEPANPFQDADVLPAFPARGK